MQSARLKYMRIEQGHSPLLFSLFTDEKVRQYLGGVLAYAAAIERVATMVAHPHSTQWAMQNENAEYVGLISLGLYYDGKSTELNYSLMPEFWGGNTCVKRLNIYLFGRLSRWKLKIYLPKLNVRMLAR